jgi:hypothetical protein
MTEQPHAVYDAYLAIVAVFSTEDLAQTHAAKLRTAATAVNDGGDRASQTYTVAPLVMNADLDLEVVHVASIVLQPEDIADYSDADIEVALSGDLARVLPPTIQDSFLDLTTNSSPGGDVEEWLTWVSIDAYGWTREQAVARLRRAIARYLAEPQSDGAAVIHDE